MIQRNWEIIFTKECNGENVITGGKFHSGEMTEGKFFKNFKSIIDFSGCFSTKNFYYQGLQTSILPSNSKRHLSPYYLISFNTGDYCLFLWTFSVHGSMITPSQNALTDSSLSTSKCHYASTLFLILPYWATPSLKVINQMDWTPLYMLRTSRFVYSQDFSLSLSQISLFNCLLKYPVNV